MVKKSKHLFKVIWSKTNLGIAVNEIHKENYNTPLTTFYFWPREDGWKLLKAELDSKPWMSEISKLEILNSFTLIVNNWLKNLNKNINIQNASLEKLALNIEILGVNSIS